MDFKDKVVLITGAGAGIGRAAAIKFESLGAKVGVNCQTESKGLEVVSAFLNPKNGLFLQGDVSKEEDCTRIINALIEKFGKIDILVNNAGIVRAGTISDATIEDWDRTMDVNVRGVFLMSQGVIPYMKKNGGGVIVNVSSSVAHKGVKNRAAYTASKGAILSLTRAMAMDLLEDHIRVNTVSPGTTDTPSLSERLAVYSDPEKARADFVARQPMGRLGTSEEVAEAILFAASDEAGFMDGANISIDGAMTC